MFFKNINPKNELDSLDRALEILQDRYEKKVITLEQFSAECEKIRKKREKYEKVLKKQGKTNY